MTWRTCKRSCFFKANDMRIYLWSSWTCLSCVSHPFIIKHKSSFSSCESIVFGLSGTRLYRYWRWNFRFERSVIHCVHFTFMLIHVVPLILPQSRILLRCKKCFCFVFSSTEEFITSSSSRKLTFCLKQQTEEKKNSPELIKSDF